MGDSKQNGRSAKEAEQEEYRGFLETVWEINETLAEKLRKAQRKRCDTVDSAYKKPVLLTKKAHKAYEKGDQDRFGEIAGRYRGMAEEFLDREHWYFLLMMRELDILNGYMRIAEQAGTEAGKSLEGLATEPVLHAWLEAKTGVEERHQRLWETHVGIMDLQVEMLDMYEELDCRDQEEGDRISKEMENRTAAVWGGNAPREKENGSHDLWWEREELLQRHCAQFRKYRRLLTQYGNLVREYADEDSKRTQKIPEKEEPGTERDG